MEPVNADLANTGRRPVRQAAIIGWILRLLFGYGKRENIIMGERERERERERGVIPGITVLVMPGSPVSVSFSHDFYLLSLKSKLPQAYEAG